MVIARTVGGGDIAFLTGHAPFVGALDIDPVPVRAEDGADEVIAVHGGFVEVSNDRVTVLSDVAEVASQIDVERAGPPRSAPRPQLRAGDDVEAEAALRRAPRAPRPRRAPRSRPPLPAAVRRSSGRLTARTVAAPARRWRGTGGSGSSCSCRNRWPPRSTACAAPSATARVSRIAPHITLVPPGQRGRARPAARLHASCGRPRRPSHRSRLRLGPVATFAPVNPVAYLQVGGEPQVLDALERLRTSCLAGPARAPVGARVRPPRHRRRRARRGRASTRSTRLLADFVVETTIDRVHVLAELPGRIWRPVADAPLGERPAVVGRGQPSAGAHRVRASRRRGRGAALVRGGDGRAALRGHGSARRRRGRARPGAGRHGAPSRSPTSSSRAEHRGQGVGRHLLAAVVALARRRECELVGASAPRWRAAARSWPAAGFRLLDGAGRRGPPMGALARAGGGRRAPARDGRP